MTDGNIIFVPFDNNVEQKVIVKNIQYDSH